MAATAITTITDANTNTKPKTKPKPKLEKIFFCVDIETTGCVMDVHKMVSIGVCVGDEKEQILHKFKINFKVDWPITADDGTVTDYADFEPRCWREFWSKRATAEIENLTADALAPGDGTRQLAKFLDLIEELYPMDRYKIVFLSDNASFDIATINHYLWVYCNRLPMRYTSGLRYRPLKAPDDMLDMMGDDYVGRVQRTIAKADHDPANDAENILDQYYAVLKARKIIERLTALHPEIMREMVPELFQ